MFRRAAIVLSLLIFAFGVLGTSVLRTTQPTYVFSQQQPSVAAVQTASPSARVEYYLAYPGILPDSLLWPLKALRDRVWLFLTRDSARRAELLLLFADKRVGMADILVRGGKPEIGVATALKAEQYLEQALQETIKAEEHGVDTGQLLDRLARASLKHTEVLQSLMDVVPEDARPELNKVLSTPREVYEKSTHGLNEKGRPVPAAGLQE